MVQRGDVPLEVPLEDIEALRARTDEAGVVTLAPNRPPGREPWPSGTSRWVTAGVFTGHRGRIALDEGEDVLLRLKLFKQWVTVAMAPSAVSPV